MTTGGGVTSQLYSGVGEDDGKVHLVDARPDGLLDPSPYRTRCGQRVLEIYNSRHATTCPTCARTE